LFLVPLGGGKDSLVSLEIIKEQQRPVVAFVLNQHAVLKALLERTGVPVMRADRFIDPALIAMGTQGFLNGHTPFHR